MGLVGASAAKPPLVQIRQEKRKCCLKRKMVRVLKLLHSISASSKHFSYKELASVNMSVRHIENLDFFLAEEAQEPSSG